MQDLAQAQNNIEIEINLQHTDHKTMNLPKSPTVLHLHARVRDLTLHVRVPARGLALHAHRRNLHDP